MKNSSRETTLGPQYKDTYLRLGISFFAGAYMTMYRERESFYEAVYDPGFWTSALFSFGLSLLLFWIIRSVTVRLDRRFPWRDDTLRRLIAQAGWGYVVPVCITFLLVAVFFKGFFDIDIRDTEYIAKDFPMARMFILMGNVYYMAWHLWVVPANLGEKLQFDEEQPIRVQDDGLETDRIPQREFVEYNEKHFRRAEPEIRESDNERELFLAETDEGIVPVPQESIAAIFRQDDHVLLRTLERQTLIIKQSVTEAYRQINNRSFFKINARFIVNYKICRSFRSGENRKLNLELGPPINLREEVSRNCVADFTKWIER